MNKRFESKTGWLASKQCSPGLDDRAAQNRIAGNQYQTRSALIGE